MSKVSFSRELLGTIRFIFDKTKSRTLNATQAYDISTSQIVLGSFPATASKKLLTKGLGVTEGDSFDISGSAAVTFTATGGLDADPDSDLLRKANRDPQGFVIVPTSANVTWAPTDELGLTKNKNLLSLTQASTATFFGNIVGYQTDLLAGAATKSNAAKDIFYGAITVGTGLYREWQGKYAVLKVDLLTNKAILRVYNE